MLTLVSSIVTIAVNLIRAPRAVTGLGPALYVAIEDTEAIANGLTSVSTPEDVATLLADDEISAQAAADLGAALANGAPLVYVATYDTGASETPDDALDRATAAVSWGVVAQESRANTDNAAIGTWLNASSIRRWTKVASLQSAEAGLLTSGRPSALAACEVPTVVMHYHATSTVSQAAAHLGRLVAHPMLTRAQDIRTQLIGVALTTVTSAQAAFAKANGACILLPNGAGASASQRTIDQTLTYDGSEGAPVLSIVLSIRRALAGVEALLGQYSQRGEPLRADRTGAAAVTSALVAQMQPLAVAGHFLPGTLDEGTPDETPAPDGYVVETTPSGTELLAQITQRYGPSATRIAITDDAIIVTE